MGKLWENFGQLGEKTWGGNDGKYGEIMERNVKTMKIIGRNIENCQVFQRQSCFSNKVNKNWIEQAIFHPKEWDGTSLCFQRTKATASC